MVLADDWTYCDIGLSWGLKSCAHSITDCLAMTDYSPSVKACINLDALAYAMVAESYPDVRETGQFPRPSAGVAVRDELMVNSFGPVREWRHRSASTDRRLAWQCAQTIAAQVARTERCHPRKCRWLRLVSCDAVGFTEGAQLLHGDLETIRVPTLTVASPYKC